VTVFRAPLACIHWTANQQFDPEDCRRFFPPLTSVTAGAQALHVTEISWPNDDVVRFDALLAKGLTVVLDQAPSGRIDASIFRLTLEVPVASALEARAVAGGLAPITLYTAMPLDGQITVQHSSINWNLPFHDPKAGGISGIQLEALFVLNAILSQGVAYHSFARARVTLQGRDVYTGSGSAQIFLDGQVFGTPGVRADGITPRTDLIFNSGTGEKASDFESWFFLAPTFSLVSLSVQPGSVSFTPSAPNPPAPVATLTVNSAATVDTVVPLSLIPPATGGAAVTLPPSVTVPRGSTSVVFTVGVRNSGNSNPEVYGIAASVTNALGFTNTVTATVTVTGFQIIL
jgi:hypothetical protein